MSDISPIVTVTLDIDATGPVTADSFGVLGILTHDAPWSDRVRYYGSAAEALADGFTTDHPVYRALARCFAQNPKPSAIAVLRATVAVRQMYEIGVAQVQDGVDYDVTVAGQGFVDADLSYTAGVSETNDNIVAALVTRLNGVAARTYTAEAIGTALSKRIQVTTDEPLVYADKTFTAAGTDIVTITGHGLNTGDGPFRTTNSGGALPAGLAVATDYWWIKLTADTGKFAATRGDALTGTAVDITDAGTGTHTLSDTASTRALVSNSWLSIEVKSRRLLTNAMTHAAPVGLGADLDAIVEVDNGWFGLGVLFGSAAYALAVATWLDANSRISLLDSCDSETETEPVATGTDAAAQLHAVSPRGVNVCYHASPANFLGLASMARWFTRDPGLSVPFLKTLSGVSALSLNTNARARIAERAASSYTTIGGANVFVGGAVPDPDYRWIDVVRNAYFMTSGVQGAVFATMRAAEIIPFDQAGIQRITGATEGWLTADGANVLDTDTVVVTAPKLADVDPDDKAARVLREAFTGTLRGAAYSVNVAGNIRF